MSNSSISMKGVSKSFGGGVGAGDSRFRGNDDGVGAGDSRFRGNDNGKGLPRSLLSLAMTGGGKVGIAGIAIAAWLFLAASPAAAQIDLSRELADPAINPERTSVAAVDTATGKLLAGHRAELALNPASCAKLLTSLAALKIMGPGYRFRTLFASDGPVSNGAIGVLYVKGFGDPSLVNEELFALGIQLRAYGIRRITGGIVIDNSYFDSFEYPRKGGNHDRAYTARTSALAVNFNSIGIEVAPGRAGGPAKVVLDPPVEIYRVANRTVTQGKTKLGITMGAGGDARVIAVGGRISPRAGATTFWRAAADPVEYAGAVIAHQFREAGIEVAGPVRSGTLPAGAHFIAEQFSKPMIEIVNDMNKLSTNFTAEQVTKSLGAFARGAPGSTEKGVAAIKDYLASIGIPKNSVVLENGSGLSAHSKISAANLVKLLVAAYRDADVRGHYLDSLSVLGVDGTMRSWNRMAPDLSGVVLAKTGTLDGVSTLAGYAPAPGGGMAAFAILMEGLPRGPWAAKEAQMKLLRSISGGAR